MKIVKWFLENEKDPAKYNTYFDELMKVYDQRIQYFPTYQNTPAASVLGMKAVDYMQYSKNPDINQAYSWLSESVNKMKENSEFYILQTFMDVSAQKFKNDEAHREQFIQDYLDASKYTEEAIKIATKEKDKNNYKVVKENLDAFFINSGASIDLWR